MPFVLDFLGLACFSAAAYSYYYLNSRYVDALFISGVILFTSAQMLSGILMSLDKIRKPDLESSLKLDEISARLLRIQLAIENLDRHDFNKKN